MKEPFGLIYQVHNQVTGKNYVGQTTVGLKERWRRHCLASSGCKILKRAIAKYGVKSFDLTTLDLGYSQEDLDKKEIYWIQNLNTNVPNGYNLSSGGEGGGNQHPLIREKKSKGRQKFLASLAAKGLPKGPTTLTEADVHEVFRRYNEGEKQKSIAHFFKVDRSTISHIIEGKNWSHLGLNPTKIRKKNLNLEQNYEIFRLNSTGISSRKIGLKLGVSKDTVNRILREKKNPGLTEEFGERKYLAKITLPEVITKAKELRSQRLTYQEIGFELGVHESTAWTYCNK
jgi:group I intron endonuclease